MNVLVYWLSTGMGGRVVACVSRYSSVLGMSRMDLAPAQTTATGERANSVRSLDTSMLVSPPLCTPPMPACNVTTTESGGQDIVHCKALCFFTGTHREVYVC